MVIGTRDRRRRLKLLMGLFKTKKLTTEDTKKLHELHEVRIEKIIVLLVSLSLRLSVLAINKKHD